MRSSRSLANSFKPRCTLKLLAPLSQPESGSVYWNIQPLPPEPIPRRYLPQTRLAATIVVVQELLSCPLGIGVLWTAILSY